MASLVFIPPLTPINGLVLASAVGQVVLGLGELTGARHMPYSKFAHLAKLARPVPSRPGMVTIYLLGLLASLVSAMLTAPPPELLQRVLHYGGVGDDAAGAWRALLVAHRPFVLALLMAAHFAKRELECLFLHRYSGSIELSAVLAISIAYGQYAALMAWTATQVTAEFLAQGPALRLPWGVAAQPPTLLPLLPLTGAALVAVGMAGNLYHHWLLSRLRNGVPNRPPGFAATTSPAPIKVYFAPRGGLFAYVVCPHYSFELLAWLGIALVSQHAYAYLSVLTMGVYLAGRAAGTRRFYESKLDDFPKGRRLLVPFLL